MVGSFYWMLAVSVRISFSFLSWPGINQHGPCSYAENIISYSQWFQKHVTVDRPVLVPWLQSLKLQLAKEDKLTWVSIRVSFYKSLWGLSVLLPFYTMRLRRAVKHQVARPETSKHTGVHVMRKFGITCIYVLPIVTHTCFLAGKRVIHRNQLTFVG